MSVNVGALLVDRAGAAGDIHPGVDPNELLRALVGFTYGNATPAGGPVRCGWSTSRSTGCGRPARRADSDRSI
jgi:hypothetical protein